MSTFSVKVKKAKCQHGDLVVDGLSLTMDLYVYTIGGLERLNGIPHLVVGDKNVTKEIILKLPTGERKPVMIHDNHLDGVRKINSLLIGEDEKLKLYKFMTWDVPEWIVWEVKEVKVL